MIIIVRFIILLQMLFINLYTYNKCSVKKRSSFIIIVCLTVFTCAFIAFLYFTVSKLPQYGSGSGIYMLTGFLYIIPLLYLYNQPIKHTIIIMCSSWLYTMFAFSLSIRFGKLFSDITISISVLAFQTVFYMITLPLFMKYVREDFLYILKNISKRTTNILLIMSIFCYSLLLLVNYLISESKTYYIELLIMLLIAGNIVLSYKMLHSMISANETAKELTETVKRDALTQLKNREGLLEDAQNMIEKNQPFVIVFVDLDNFKNINDCHGHSAGDKYLIEFVKALKKKLDISDDFYRLSGDEFVILYDGVNVESLCCELKHLAFGNEDYKMSFQGLSVGCSFFPADGTSLSVLLNKADLNMYQEKKKKHRAELLAIDEKSPITDQN